MGKQPQLIDCGRDDAQNNFACCQNCDQLPPKTVRINECSQNGVLRYEEASSDLGNGFLRAIYILRKLQSVAGKR